MKKYLVFTLSFLLTGCYVQTDDLEQHIAQVKQKTKVKIEPYPEFTTMPAYKYEATNLRSPFQRPKNTVETAIQATKANCLQPDLGRPKGRLEEYGIDALLVAGQFTSNGKKWVLIKANDGTLHKATIGDYLGLFFGKITSIDNGKVSFVEMLPDGAGCWQRKQATLSMASKAGENENV